MRTDTPQPMKLSAYAPYPFEIETARLVFELDPDATLVTATLNIKRTGAAGAALELNGEALELLSIRLDGRPVPREKYELGNDLLILPDVPDTCVLETRVRIAPSKNTALSGLFISGDRFCSQCEAEGFRRITFWPDRPDVMSRFSVRIEADAETYPVLMSNGSPGETGSLPLGRHFAEWDDPHPKPSYLFALCAGRYDTVSDSFTTQAGRDVALNVHVDPGNGARAHYAMDALKRSMRWDEEVFGRAYDLDVFNIVAVRDFNFGAMENKGLNIFNSAYVLADPESATDSDYEAIESIVAHEYFHNWTGNRITCRDWFQLCLKEGLTVFRDQEFSADMRDREVQRIKDVIRLRARQFPEDAGPLAHPVRPRELGSIDNLYTATVYEKGAELIRMLKALIGADAFARGMTLYFARHDGEAITIEDFYACFAEAAGRDLDPFLRWYDEIGTPRVSAALRQTTTGWTLKLERQRGETSPERSDPLPPMPLAMSVFDADTGEEIEDLALPNMMDRDTMEVPLALPTGVARPLLSFNRGFAAPIRTDLGLDTPDLIRLSCIDSDAFNQWDVLQALMREDIASVARGVRAGSDPDLAEAVASAVRSRIDRPALAALMMRAPSVSDIFLEVQPADPEAIGAARTALKRKIATALSDLTADILSVEEPAPFAPSAEQAGQRALRAALMDLLALQPDGGPTLEAIAQAAHSMTESLAALSALGEVGGTAFEDALARFETRWRDVPTVMDKWFSVQAIAGGAEAVERVERLTGHPAFDLRTPNRVRGLLGAFAMQNLSAFHRRDGRGHQFLAEKAMEIDALNPALAARLLTAFEQWRRLTPELRDSAHAELTRLSRKKLSKNVSDIVNRALG